MAESVDALVSNTSGATRAGSTPALGTGFEATFLFIYSSIQLGQEGFYNLTEELKFLSFSVSHL